MTDDLASLVKQIDEQVSSNKEKELAAFVVLLSDDPDAAARKLEEIAKKENIKNVPLTVFDGAAGPSSYKLAKDAAVTVIVWKGLEVQANHAFKKGELKPEGVKAVVASTKKILE